MRMKTLLLISALVFFASPLEAAKKDLKAIFGSYQREKFTENEARDSDWGVDLSLSSMLPITSVVNSITTAGGTSSPMRYSTFLNVEGSLLFSLAYHWQLYASTGYFTYDTRKENNSGNEQQALFHLFDFHAIPFLLGVRYRFGVDDLVPYLGLGAGVSRITRKGYYDSGDEKNEETLNALTGQIQGGVEFYFSPNAGLRLELAAHLMKTPETKFDPPGNISVNPDLIYQPNVFSLRYSSGLFYLF